MNTIRWRNIPDAHTKFAHIIGFELIWLHRARKREPSGCNSCTTLIYTQCMKFILQATKKRYEGQERESELRKPILNYYYSSILSFPRFVLRMRSKFDFHFRLYTSLYDS